MKKITFLLIVVGIIVTACHTFAQRFKDGDYIKSEKIDKFVGTWQWSSGDSSFIIVLKKEKMKLESDFAAVHVDALKGYHRLVVGENVLVNTLPTKRKTITGMEGGPGRENQLIILFSDITKSKSGKGKLELLPGGTDIARWKLGNTPGVHAVIDGQEPDYTFTVPTDVIMRRIKKKNK